MTIQAGAAALRQMMEAVVQQGAEALQSVLEQIARA